MFCCCLKKSAEEQELTMKYNYSGKVVLVTGSSSGIGEGIARELASFGASLVITGRSRVNVARVASDCYRLSKVKVREKS